MTHRFQVAGYPIHLGPLHEAADLLPSATRLFLVCDENTARHCLSELPPHFWQKKQETGDAEAFKIEIPSGEKHKNLQTAERLWRAMQLANLDRKALVLNLGGGVIGDLGGFCAATWKRGLPFVQVPTTLLAMTDAAVGGKLGIDFQGIKNTIGVFQNPAAVLVDPVFLRTLPERELRSGLAEVIKHGFVGSPDLLRVLAADFQANAADTAAWQAVLALSIAVKVRVVREDPLEKNLRMILNFGHTIGHAIESYFLESNAPLTHGEAIAMGMVFESFIAQKNYAAVRLLVDKFFPKRPLSPDLAPALWAMMQQDKKNVGTRVRIAVPTDGDFGMQVMDITEAQVRACIDAH